MTARSAALTPGCVSGEPENSQAKQDIDKISEWSKNITPKIQEDATKIKNDLKAAKGKDAPDSVDQSVDLTAKMVAKHAEELSRLVTSAQTNQATKSKIQPADLFKWGLVIIYICSLGVAVWFWYRTPNVDSVIPNLGKSLLGMIISAASIVLVV